MTARVVDLAEHRRLALFRSVLVAVGPQLSRSASDFAPLALRASGPAVAIVDPRDELGRRVLSRVPFGAVALFELEGRRVGVVLASAQVLASLLDDDPAAARVRVALEPPEVRCAIVAHGGVSLSTLIAASAAAGPTRTA